MAARFLEAVRLPRGAALSIMHVIEIPHVAIRFPGQQLMLADWRKKAAADAHRLIGRLVPPLRAQGLRVRPLVREGLPGPLLLNTVKRVQADLAILGSHGYSRFMRFLLGSVSELLVSEAPASVLIVRSRPRGHVEEDADRVLAHISGMGRVDLSQALEQAMRERKRRTLLMLERMGRRFAQRGVCRRSRLRAWGSR